MGSLKLKKISKYYGDVVALSRVDLSIDEGEFCVLLGPSGCGKSTLLQIIAGLIPQYEGSVLIDDQPVDHLTPRERDVAMVFQSYALYPHMTVAQNLAFGLRMHGVPRAVRERRIIETAELLGITHLLARKPRQLSGGQRQRVAMGRALVRRPNLFLFDEPLSNLDARLRVNVRLELKRVHQQTRGTILYVTHDQVEAMTLGDKVVVMQNGSVLQAGHPETIYDSPADIFVATFIGSPPMNIFEGKVERINGQFMFQGEDFSLNLKDIPQNLSEKRVELGIRPEDIEIVHKAEDALRVKVEMISNVGSEKFIHARLGSNDMTIRIAKEADIRLGEIIQVVMKPSMLNIFYNGRRI
ncbi:MAG: ABC transporter ATP-binding protein [Thermodesulfobacteriota bacterium]|nr:ABC transporter ATP-binding protein [Thermodesulfobacteriota bacterium]